MYNRVFPTAVAVNANFIRASSAGNVFVQSAMTASAIDGGCCRGVRTVKPVIDQRLVPFFVAFHARCIFENFRRHRNIFIGDNIRCKVTKKQNKKYL